MAKINFISTIDCGKKQFEQASFDQKLGILAERFCDLGVKRYKVSNFNLKRVQLEKIYLTEKRSLASVILRIAAALTIVFPLIAICVKAYFRSSNQIVATVKKSDKEIPLPAGNGGGKQPISPLTEEIKPSDAKTIPQEEIHQKEALPKEGQEEEGKKSSLEPQTDSAEKSGEILDPETKEETLDLPKEAETASPQKKSMLQRKDAVIHLPKYNIKLTASKKGENASIPHFSLAESSEVLSLQEKLIQTDKCPALDLIKIQDKHLLPFFKLQIDNATYYISHSFGLLSSEEAAQCHGMNQYMAVGLIKIGDDVHARLFYHSNSQGTWRVCPHAEFDQNGQIKWIGKGMKESDTQLPIPLIAAMNLQPFYAHNPLYDEKIVVKLKESLPARKNFEDAIDLTSSFKLNHLVPSSLAPTDSYKNIIKKRDLVKAKTKGKKDRDHAALQIKKSSSPDFRKKTEAVYQLPLYGKVKATVVHSKDKEVRYLFHEVLEEGSILKGCTYLATVEKVREGSKIVPISKFGQREQFFDLNNLDSPLAEYPFQVEVGYEPNNKSKIGGKYWANWNYVREKNLVAAYYNAQKRPLPEEL